MPRENHVSTSSSSGALRAEQVQWGGLVRVLAVMLPQENVPSLEQALTSVDSIEAATGLDFFWELPDDVERPVEAEVARSLWPVK